MSNRAALLAAALAAAMAATVTTGARAEPPTGGAGGAEFVLSPEGNHLWAYDATTRERQLLARAENGDDAGGEEAPNRLRRDINGQVCVSPDGRHVVTGEDTVVDDGSGGEGPGSHDPRIAGWGYFRIRGDELGELRIDQVGKLAPESAGGPGYAGDPDNYGCAFLDDHRLLTTAIGDRLPGEDANGQLFLWFGPFDAGYRTAALESGERYFTGEVPHCVIDASLATAGGIDVADDGAVYVAANRPTDLVGGDPSAVWRYTGEWPTSPAECAGNPIVKERVLPVLPAVPADPTAPTPSAVLVSPSDTLYVSSVFTGTVSEYGRDGTFRRDVHPTSPVAVRTGPTGDTPFGLAQTSDGALWIADLGIFGADAAAGEGSVLRVPPGGGPAEVVADGLDFPDGLGVYAPRRAPLAPFECPHWSMYGADLHRSFAAGCPSPIDPTTVQRLLPAWFLDTPKPVTASPAVVDGVVYVGSWEPAMYALDAETGRVLWRHEPVDAPGATFGPIVSSAAVADVRVRGDERRLVVFGAGPRVYALDAADGSEVWVHDASLGIVDTPTEYESSPLVWDDLVLIGRDTHNEPVSETGGVRGGLVALDAGTGAVRWIFEPELDQPGVGCGGMWSSPTLDTELGYAFLGTANCPVDDETYVWTPHVNAVTAVDVRNGRPVWSFQPNVGPARGGAPDDDTDFGATPNLFVDASGRRVLGAGKKDGAYYALDPATGRLLWSAKVAEPAPNVGGFIGSPAVWRGNVFGGTAIGSPPYFHSLDSARNGAVRFQGGIGPTYGATTVVNGVAFNAALDDVLKAYDTETGALLWAAPLAGPGSSAAAIAGDMVFIGSGTSSSDLCGKDNVYDEACFFLFDEGLASLGGIHAFRLGGTP